MTLTLRTGTVVLSGLLCSGFLAEDAQAASGAQIATTGARAKFVAGPKVRQQVRALRGTQPKLRSVLDEQSADAHVSQVLKHSASNGNYYVVSDLHFGVGKAHPNGAFDRQEDFTRGDVWQRTLDHISKQKGNNTLVLGGDALDILEHVNPEDGLDKVGAAMGQMVRGHAAEWKALAKGVVNDGLRVVYIRGNHDIRMLDATSVATGGAPIRERFLEEIMNVGELTPAQRQVFKERVAFAGHAAPLGKFGEMMVYHGEQQDPTNSWRSPANPYSYTKTGARQIPRTLGDHIVRDEWVKAEIANPDGDNLEESAVSVVARRVLTNKKALGSAAKLLWAVSAQRVETGPAQQLAEKIDDRLTLQSWAERTGFTQMMNTPLGDGPARGLSSRDYAKKLQLVYGAQPQPIQERMTSRLHVVNVANELFGKNRLAATPDAEPHFLRDITTTMPNVRFVVSGHDHAERIRIGTMKDRGEVGFFDSGTWTKTHGEDRLNVVVAHTGANGRIESTPRLFRVNPANGAPEFQPRAFEELNHVDNWAAPTR